MNSILNPQKGAILLIVLIVVLTISLLGATLMTLFFNVLTTSRIELYRAQALYLADAGLAAAISTLRQQAGKAAQAAAQAPVVVVNEPGQPLQRIVSRTNLGEGYFEVFGDILGQTLVSYGTSHGVTRTVQIKYSAF